MDTAIYDTFARMSQSFTNNSPLCEFHGSNGNQIIPEAASSRYTEVRLSKLGLEMFEGIKKKNVPFIMNFDETVEWPEVLPSPLPMLMINGSEGIGTTIAQKWLPYDATEVSEAYKKYLLTGEMDYTLCPSFPSGGIIINQKDLPVILKTGKGKVILRAKAEIKKNIISITEICYQTCVRDLMEDFKKLYDADELPGVEDIQNMSGKNGVDIRIICEKNAIPEKVLSMLYRKTNLQKSYSANQNLLINKIPELVSTEKYFQLLYTHNDECLIKEYTYDKTKAEIRKEECEGLLIAIAHIDDIIALVRASEDKASAKKSLIEKYSLTDRQADCILKMTIGQLTKLDGLKIENELKELISTLEKLNALLDSKDLRKNVLVETIDKLINKYKTSRKTELTHIELKSEEKEIAEVIPEDVVVVTTQSGLIKRVPVASFKIQKRGGKGVKSNDDAILDVIKTNTVDTMMFFTSTGKMYRTVVDNIPVGTNATKGTMISDFVKLDNGEKVIAVTSLHRKSTPKYVLFFTKEGMIKKSYLEEYMSARKNTGIAALKVKEGDEVVDIIFQDEEDIIVITKDGYSVKFETKTINPIGRVGMGVKAIKLNEGDEVVAALPVHKDTDTVAVFTSAGLGKKVALKEFPIQARGGKGTIVYKPSQQTGVLVGAAMVSDEDNLLICGNTSTICFSASEIPLVGKLGQGNILIKNTRVVSITKL